LFGIGVTYGGLTLLNYVQEQRERMRYRAQFNKYVSPDIVEELLENREGLALGGKRRHITVLFSDVRDFTKISEENDPETIVTLLSDYLGKVTKIVFDNGGTVDKFIGDAVMAIFGAPKSYGNDAERAVRTGVEMLQLAAAMAPQWQQAIGRPLKIGVGINTGDAVVGSIGSEIRSDYTAIGDAVNTASRLEGMTKELGVPLLMSEFTAAEIKDGLEITSLGKVQVIGRATPLGVFTTSDIAAAQGIEAVDPSQVRRQQHK
jgi:adenylate cyclase